MNRTFEERKPTKVYAKSEENKAIIKSLNIYGRVPEQWELLKEIEKLKQENKQLKERIEYLERSNNRREDIILEYRTEDTGIVAELEKWLNLEISIHNEDDTIDILYSCVLNKIQELKEKYK